MTEARSWGCFSSQTVNLLIRASIDPEGCERFVERLSMRLFGFGERPVYVKYQGLKRHRGVAFWPLPCELPQYSQHNALGLP
jgi:hypothetical protein